MSDETAPNMCAKEIPPVEDGDRPVSSVPTLETDRLILRAFRATDASDVFAYASNPRIGHDAGWPVHTSLEDSLSFIHDIASQGHTWAIIPKETLGSEDDTGNLIAFVDGTAAGTVIGSIGLIADPARSWDKTLMLGYAIGQDWWGRGYTSEASSAVIEYGFDRLELALVSCTCYPWNVASKRIIDTCGFSFEGRRRMVTSGQDGVVEDFLCHSLTKEEWLTLR